jgi:molybdenum cofactor biosynthesis enzyme MoaA
MIEWTNKYNSFNSYKGLAYLEQYKKIVGWLDGKNELPPPIEASLDPINICNQKCFYCNSQRYLREHPTNLGRWDREFIEKTIRSLASQGVKGFCWGGGGESLLNTNIKGMTRLGVDLGMECSIITNGVLIDKYIDELTLCRWVGISMDSALPSEYERIRGVDDCQKVLNNINLLVKKRTKTDICIKVLLLPDNIDSILYTCKVAKELGVQDFHVRPVDLERKDFKNRQKLYFDKKKIEDIFDKCHALETKDFHVYTVTHKYDSDFHVKHDFSKCLAPPLVKQICTDGKTYVCVDHRLEDRFEIKNWGSQEHKELLKGINPETECARCTWSEYNKQIEECVLQDRMCLNFP